MPQDTLASCTQSLSSLGLSSQDSSLVPRRQPVNSSLTWVFLSHKTRDAANGLKSNALEEVGV